MSPLMLNRTTAELRSGSYRYDAWTRVWLAADPTTDAGQPATARQALAFLAKAGRLRPVPVAAIGPRDASPTLVRVAEAVGRGVAAMGLPLLTGGRGGVMEAASRGARSAGGLTIGFIPDTDWREANVHVDIPLATGIGPARNVLIARAAEALVAVGGEYGTLSEMAFGMQFMKPVFALCDAPPVKGVTACATVEQCLDLLAESLLRLPDGISV
jgi:hypothetical protein